MIYYIIYFITEYIIYKMSDFGRTLPGSCNEPLTPCTAICSCVFGIFLFTSGISLPILCNNEIKTHPKLNCVDSIVVGVLTLIAGSLILYPVVRQMIERRLTRNYSLIN